MASIIITSGEQQGEFLPLGRRTSVIGRAENLPLQLLDDLVSHKPLRISFDEDNDCYLAEDMGSRHGVFLNRSRISRPMLLTDVGEVLLGRELSFRLAHCDVLPTVGGWIITTIGRTAVRATWPRMCLQRSVLRQALVPAASVGAAGMGLTYSHGHR